MPDFWAEEQRQFAWPQVQAVWQEQVGWPWQLQSWQAQEALERTECWVESFFMFE